MQKRYVVIDTETSALSVRHGGRVIEVGAVVIENGCIVGEFSSLINTGTPISYGAYGVHGINTEMLANQPLPHQVWPLFIDFVGNSPLIAHNASFDNAFINHELNLLDLPFKTQWYCTVSKARLRLPQLPNHRLDTVYRHLFGEIPAEFSRHRALDDARMAALIWCKLHRTFN